MGRSDAAIRRCWQEWMDSGRFQHHDERSQPRATADREDRLIVRSAVTASDSLLSTIRHDKCPSCWNHAEWRRIVFRDESCFQLRPDDNRRRVWRLPGQRADPAFTIAHHTGPQPGVMIWVPFLLTAGLRWSSLEAHLQHNCTSTPF
ncbi:HTH_Tnp_Tc3_2 domain-containing protein [Trichonephila clavipes]|nr:HTH_Tnp_Tc3_2 domain-containing protein [Trichonephila clavipes]